MKRSSSIHATAAFVAIFCAGCFPVDSSDSDGGTSSAFTGPTLEVTVSGVHFGPAAPDPGSFVDLVTTRDASGTATGSSFRLAASVDGAGCNLTFDTFGGADIGVGQYKVESMQGGLTLDGTVYPTSGEHFTTPEGPASCSGSDCDNAAFVISAADAAHVTGYYMGTVTSDQGLGQASVVCSFWLKPRTYTP
jgi:hypothetical protein